VPHGDAAANAGRAGLLVHAMANDPALLWDATRDWLHQDYRQRAMRQSYELMKELRGRGCAAVISGAGPTVLVLGRTTQLAALAEQTFPGFRTITAGVGVGARVVAVNAPQSSGSTDVTQ
jgi:homoserine kinase